MSDSSQDHRPSPGASIPRETHFPTAVSLLGSTALALSMLATPVSAQTTQGGEISSKGVADAAEQNAEDIVVTGTAIRGVAPVGSATLNIKREDILASGVRDPGAIIAQLPQGSSLGTTLTTSGGRSQGVNLRGLGNNATLLLFDGHRTVPQAVTAQISDPNIIPFAAIERVEVVTDGASAVYGSDAVAGVVNYVLRKDFEGLEVSARFTDTLYNQKAIDFVTGHNWGSGGIILAFSHEENTAVLAERPQLPS